MDNKNSDDFLLLTIRFIILIFIIYGHTLKLFVTLETQA